jgi:hypothetical protein
MDLFGKRDASPSQRREPRRALGLRRRAWTRVRLPDRVAEHRVRRVGRDGVVVAESEAITKFCITAAAVGLLRALKFGTTFF